MNPCFLRPELPAGPIEWIVWYQARVAGALGVFTPHRFTVLAADEEHALEQARLAMGERLEPRSPIAAAPAITAPQVEYDRLTFSFFDAEE